MCSRIYSKNRLKEELRVDSSITKSTLDVKEAVVVVTNHLEEEPSDVIKRKKQEIWMRDWIAKRRITEGVRARTSCVVHPECSI